MYFREGNQIYMNLLVLTFDEVLQDKTISLHKYL